MSEFLKLRQANILRDKEWDPEKKITPLFRATELGGECGEALGVVKKLVREECGLPGSRKTRENLAEELADVVICADLLAMEYGIDLWEATKLKFNITSDNVGLSVRIEE